ncbi:MAG: class II aldolase/adducin family protein [Candidatus ainarchaeum sp.]|nr:class II aldolase/adducin family protein [Candidatus ainarchaeum sp.]
MEKYTGVKFKVIEIKNSVANTDLERMLFIDKIIKGYVKVNKNEGNFSLRMENGFLIKKSGSRMTDLKKEDVVFVKKIEDEKVYASGGTPSSESLMHNEIYNRRKDARIVLHFHEDKLLLKRFEFETNEYEYGSIEIAKEVGELIEKSWIVKIKNHGFVIIASDEKDLKEKLEKIKLRK